MAEYIDREVLLKKIFPLGVLTDLKYTINAHAVKYAVESVKKADVVSVVRCRDCKYRQDRLYCRRVKGHPYIVTNTDYCSYGERKDNNGKL